MIFNKTLITFSFFIFASSVFSQQDLVDGIFKEKKPKREYVAYTFKTTRVISGHSVETVKKNALDFRVGHRFGDIAVPGISGHTLGGIDAASDILISLEYGILDDLTVGIGRTKGAGPFKELYNGFVKYRALKQTEDFKIPMTITFLGNGVVSSQRNDPFVGGQRLKGQPASHRFSYMLQSLIAVKATSWLSVQLSPTFLWRNYVPHNDQNGMFFLGFASRAKFTKRFGMVFEYFLPITAKGGTYREYFPMLRGRTSDAGKPNFSGYFPALNIGFEFETGGHVFHVNLTNSEALVENDMLPYTAKNWAQGQFRLGFTISRIFQFGKGGTFSKWGKKNKEKG